MEAMKEKLRQKLLQKKEQATTSTNEEDYINKVNQFKEKKY